MIDEKYEIISELGRGGFGTVFKARNASLNKVVAIKVLHATLVMDQVTRSRFELEARAGANLSHPNLVSVFDYGFTERGEPYLVMEYVEGVSLEDFLSTTYTTDDLITILIQVGKALRYLHDSNIVHRDLKTSNILVQNIGGEIYARLLDLGIAKVFTPESTGGNSANLTSTGMIFGSPAYMSPEQCQGQQIDARSDIYSFGCVIYQCLSGDHPFKGENSLQVILKHLHETPPPLNCKTQREQDLAQVASKCMAKEPKKRYQSVKELIDALQKILMVPVNERSAASRQDNLSRSYLKVSEPPPAANPGALNMVATVVALVLFAACLIPVGAMVFNHFSKAMQAKVEPAMPGAGMPASNVIARPSVGADGPSALQTAPSATAIAPSNPSASELSQQSDAQATILRLQEERAAAEKAKAELKAQQIQAAQQELQRQEDELAALQARNAQVKAAQEQAQALSRASQESFALVTKQQRMLADPVQSLNRSNDAMRRINETMSQRNTLQQYDYNRH